MPAGDGAVLSTVGTCAALVTVDAGATSSLTVVEATYSAEAFTI